MDEIFPVLGGVVLGLAAGQLSLRVRWIAIALLAALIAYTASKISGEFDQNWRLVLVDGAEVVIAAALAARIGYIAATVPALGRAIGARFGRR
jgi:hypothetical protein